MADNEIIGRTSCPVCGCAGQDVKINKNNKLYMFCDNGCAVKWNSAQSRKYLPQLRSGVAVTTETGSIIKSTIKKEITENERKNEFENSAGRDDTGSRGSYAGGRTDGEPARSTAGRNDRGERRGWLAGLLADDDDDE